MLYITCSLCLSKSYSGLEKNLYFVPNLHIRILHPKKKKKNPTYSNKSSNLKSVS